MKIKKRYYFFLILPFFLVVVSILYLININKEYIKSRFENITISEGITIKNLIEVSGHFLIESGEKNIKTFINRLYKNKQIVYIGLFKNKKIIYLLSRFEGYFPVIENFKKDIRIIDSPAGKIFEIRGEFEDINRIVYYLYIGFNYDYLTALETAASHNFLFIVVFFSLTTIFVILLIIYFNKKFIKKEMELIKTKQEKERFKELSLLTSEIAHEIKNPLNSIYLSFNALEKSVNFSNEADFYKKAIKNEIKRISDIIQSYSNLSKEIRPKIEKVNFDNFSNELNFLFKEEFKTKKIDFKCKIEKELVFKTDKNIVKQILLNLIKNSEEANASSILIELNYSKNSLNITIKDDGEGIDVKIKDKIFKPYISTKTKGMGLGLHISKRLAKSLNGGIELVSNSQGSTIFELTIPEWRKK